jgi:MFS transporter, SP family, general alpha glucoside:H+ symporter
MGENMDIDRKAAIEDAKHDTLDDLFLSANLASEQEKQVGVKEAILKYPREIFWAVIFALGLVMAGYDAQIISSLYAKYLSFPE